MTDIQDFRPIHLYRVDADVIYHHVYEIAARSELEVKKIMEDDKLIPTLSEQAISPVITSIQKVDL